MQQTCREGRSSPPRAPGVEEGVARYTKRLGRTPSPMDDVLRGLRGEGFIRLKKRIDAMERSAAAVSRNLEGSPALGAE